MLPVVPLVTTRLRKWRQKARRSHCMESSNAYLLEEVRFCNPKYFLILSNPVDLRASIDVLIALLPATPSISAELFRYRGAPKDGGTLE
jgi:hypothetical protein